MTTFKSTLAICGLSQRQAADFLNVRIDTVSSWSSGRNPPPLGVWVQLSELYSRIEEAAGSAASLMDPDMMDGRALNNLQADNGEDELPEGADNAAGAMAVLIALDNINSDRS